MKIFGTPTRFLFAPLLAAFLLPASALANEDKFERMDTDGDGYISQEEVRQKYEQKFDEMDNDNDGNVTEDEWMDAYSKHAERSMSERMKSWVGMGDEKKQKMMEKYREKFQKIDDNNNGVVTREEFTAASQKMMQKADMDGDGRISREEYKQMHKKMKDKHMKHKQGMEHGDDDESRMLDQRKGMDQEMDRETMDGDSQMQDGAGY